MLYYFLLCVTLIFHTAFFRLQSVYSVCPCQDSNFHALSKSQKLNSVHSLAGTPCACTLKALATSERYPPYFPLSSASRKWRTGSCRGYVSFEFVTVKKCYWKRSEGDILVCVVAVFSGFCVVAISAVCCVCDGIKK